jgi:hypothetical protein
VRRYPIFRCARRGAACSDSSSFCRRELAKAADAVRAKALTCEVEQEAVATEIQRAEKLMWGPTEACYDGSVGRSSPISMVACDPQYSNPAVTQLISI